MGRGSPARTAAVTEFRLRTAHERKRRGFANAPVVSDPLGSQSFAYTDGSGKKWQAVLTIYRSNADPKTYHAFIDATQLETRTKP